VDTGSWRIKNLFLDLCKEDHSRLLKNSLGWEVYPQGLYKLLLRLKKYKLSVFILENGICTYDDACRWEFISKHLEAVNQAMQKGSKVIGYIYWSLLDNFEWDKGFNPRFGLVKVDYHTQERSIRHSAKDFAEVCRTGALEI
jgi:beta-glucosidase